MRTQVRLGLVNIIFKWSQIPELRNIWLPYVAVFFCQRQPNLKNNIAFQIPNVKSWNNFKFLSGMQTTVFNGS